MVFEMPRKVCREKTTMVVSSSAETRPADGKRNKKVKAPNVKNRKRCCFFIPGNKNLQNEREWYSNRPSRVELEEKNRPCALHRRKSVSRQYDIKNVTIFGLPWPQLALHIVYPTGQPRYYLLLTAIHRFLAPLFTSISILFRTSTLLNRHDPIKTRNSACFTHWTN